MFSFIIMDVEKDLIKKAKKVFGIDVTQRSAKEFHVCARAIVAIELNKKGFTSEHIGHLLGGYSRQAIDHILTKYKQDNPYLALFLTMNSEFKK